MTESLWSISSISISRVRPFRHSSVGLTSTNTSAMASGLGSVPSSGCPALETTVRTSGIVLNSKRALRKTRAASSWERLAGMSQFIQKVPSFSSGKNSEPRREAATMDKPKPHKAKATICRRWLSAQFNRGA